MTRSRRAAQRSRAVDRGRRGEQVTSPSSDDLGAGRRVIGHRARDRCGVRSASAARARRRAPRSRGSRARRADPRGGERRRGAGCRRAVRRARRRGSRRASARGSVVVVGRRTAAWTRANAIAVDSRSDRFDARSIRRATASSSSLRDAAIAAPADARSARRRSAVDAGRVAIRARSGPRRSTRALRPPRRWSRWSRLRAPTGCGSGTGARADQPLDR